MVPTETPQRKKVHFETYGCTTNLGDTRTMEGLALAAGHELVSTPDEADVVIINTCTVIDTTDEKIGHRLRTLRAQGKEIIATGCMAAAQPERVHRDAPGVALLEPRHLHHINDAIAGRAYTPQYRPKSGLPRTLGATDAVIQLSEGCLFSCSYCLTKSARGDQASYPMHELVQDVRDAVNRGAVDIKLTAQDVSGFGFDDGPRLPELLARITEIGGDFRVRVGMMHPKTAYRIVDDLLDAMDSPKVYKFLHLPIQSGSARMLHAMNRDNSLDEFWAVVDAFRARFPAPRSVVSTDIITAFPGETDADHRATLDLLDRLQAEHVNITRFSARPGTSAKTMEGRVRTDVAKARSTELTQRALAIMHAKTQARLGEALDVLVVEEGAFAGTVLARGPAYEPVAIQRPPAEVPLGSRVEVRVVGAEPTYVVGEPVGPANVAHKSR